jgi:hypothetical protein
MTTTSLENSSFADHNGFVERSPVLRCKYY